MSAVVSLLDIASNVQTVSINGQDIAVYGVSAEGFASLMSRFPEIEKALSGRSITKEEMMKMAPDAIAAFLAAGCGLPGNSDAEKFARTLPVSAQLEMVEKIILLTFPGGFGPFVERLTALAAAVQGGIPQAPSSQNPLKS